MNTISKWFHETFTNPQILFLFLVLMGTATVILTFGNMLAPVLASMVIAYLLEGLVVILVRTKIPRIISVIIVFISFLVFVSLILLVLLPLLSEQFSHLLQRLPEFFSSGQKALMRLPDKYPEVIAAHHIEKVMDIIKSEITEFGQRIVSVSLASVTGVITILIYMVLMPLLVFFFLKDKNQIINWFLQYLPKDRGIASEVWLEVDDQIANYVRGKFVEIIIVGSASFICFSILELDYAELLAALVGLSVIIPYIGATVVTLPVLLIAWFQWGWGTDFGWLAGAYFVIQALDGNVLVPLLFSEVVNLHPVAIIVSILLFGGVWGFWGVFFAIPLATLVQAILKAWPRNKEA